MECRYNLYQERCGWLYLVAIMDWVSRFVLSQELSTTLEVDFCVQVPKKALINGTPKIFNSDQGSWVHQFIFSKCLKERGIQISMDGREKPVTML